MSLKFFSIKNPLIFISALIIGSLFPDIDSQTSILGRKVRFLSFFLKHRGFFHSVLLLALICLILLPFNKLLLVGFALGFVSHLLLDIISKEGIKLPLIGRLKGFIRVGSWQEMLFSLLLIIVIVLSFLVV